MKGDTFIIFALFPLLKTIVICDDVCERGSLCKNTSDCPSYLEELAKLDTVLKGGREYRKILSTLRKVVCNKQKRKVCCKEETVFTVRTVESTKSVNKVNTDKRDDKAKVNAQGDDNPDSPEFVPQPGQCGIAGDGAEFVYGW